MNTLTVITGPTASGKTDAAIRLAQRLGCEIINADSRQIYRDIPIATAQPDASQLAAVPHHLIAFKPLDQTYNAWQFEHDALALLPDLFERGNGNAIACGGSMMYVDALCHGIDAMPDVDPDLRRSVLDRLAGEGLDSLVADLQRLDPDYCATADLKNPRRVCHALELCLQTGQPYSTLRTGQPKPRPFAVRKYVVDIDRQTLFERINSRVDRMVEQGLEQEARRVYPLRRLNALNTVGLKEMFAYFDGTLDRDTAIARIKKNTRVYAKKQLTWLRRDTDPIELIKP